MARLTEYTDEQRAHGLAVLDSVNGNMKRAAKNLGVSRTTLRGWAGKASTEGSDAHPRQPSSELVEDQRKTLRDKWETLALMATDRAIEVVQDEKSVRNLSIAAGIATEKLELLSGRATSRNASLVIQLVAGGSLSELANVALNRTTPALETGNSDKDVAS